MFKVYIHWDRGSKDDRIQRTALSDGRFRVASLDRQATEVPKLNFEQILRADYGRNNPKTSPRSRPIFVLVKINGAEEAAKKKYGIRRGKMYLMVASGCGQSAHDLRADRAGNLPNAINLVQDIGLADAAQAAAGHEER